MATVVGSSTGAIDVKSTVDQLIEVEMVKHIDPIDAKVTAKQTSLSAVATLKSLSSTLEDSLNSFADSAKFVGTEAEKLATMTTAVQAFVTSYNALNAAVVKYGSVDLSDKTRDTVAEVPLFGDPALASIRQLMRSGYGKGLYYTNALSGRADQTSTISFSDLGVSRKTDGTLVFSKTSLAKSVALDTTSLPPSVEGSPLADSAYAQPKLLDRFSQGVVTSITKVVNGKNVQIGLKADLASAGFGIVGTFDQRTSQLNGQLYTLSKRRVTEAAKIEAERSRLLKTYSNLNSLLANMSSTSSFLTAQLASLSKNNA